MRRSPKELGEMVQRLAEARAVVAELTPIVAQELGVAMGAQVAATPAPDAAREPGVKYRKGQRLISRAEPVPITRGRPRGSSPLTSAISQALMRRAPQGPIDAQKGARLAGISVHEASKRLWQLKALGHLVRVGDGTYALPNTPQAFAGLVKGAVEAKPKPAKPPKAAKHNAGWGRLVEGSIRSKVLELAKSKPDGIITVDEVRAAGLNYALKGPGNLLNALMTAGQLTRVGPSRYQVVVHEQK